MTNKITIDSSYDDEEYNSRKTTIEYKTYSNGTDYFEIEIENTAFAHKETGKKISAPLLREEIVSLIGFLKKKLND